MAAASPELQEPKPDSGASRALAAVLWSYLERHERCLAVAAGVEAFDLVTVVPPSRMIRDERGALRRVVGDLCWATRLRHRRLLAPVRAAPSAHRFDADCFRATARLAGERVLLIEDTWATGARSQSAAHTLRLAGASAIGLVTLGRYLNPGYADIRARLATAAPVDLATCAVAACDVALRACRTTAPS